MTPLYESRQFGWKILLLTLPALILMAWVTLRDPGEAPPAWVWPLMGLITVPFSIMNVSVTRERLRVALFLGFPRQTIPIEKIATITAWKGTGLERFNARMRPFQGDFRLDGRQGVTVTTTKGREIRLSDPDPKRLIKAVEKAQARNRQVRGD